MKKRNKCEHGNDAINVQGCPECVTTAIQALNLMRLLRTTPDEMLVILQNTFKSDGAWKDAKELAQKSLPLRGGRK